MSRFTWREPSAPRSWLAAAVAALGLLLSGCPEEGSTCGESLTLCGSTCVDVSSTVSHCGACGVACGQGQMCVEGSCQTCSGGACSPYDIVATCFNTGQVVGIQSSTDTKGPNVALGDQPQTAARMQDVLLVVDAAKKLREARLVDYAALPEAPATGDVPNQVLVDDPYVYVLNSSSNTLLVFQRKAEPGPLTEGTRFPQGLQLQPVASVDFGANTNPFAMARLGTDLWVTLYGNLFGDASAGGKVARVSLANPLQTAVSTPYLQLPTGAALQPFRDHTTLPTPTGIAEHRGSLYVALNNLDPNTYGPGGPGLVARIHPQTQEVQYLSLGEGCLNPGWLASMGDKLVVSCSGEVTYDATFSSLSAVEKSALVLLDGQDAVVATYALACPEVGIGSCALPSAGRFAVVGNRVYLGDNSAGRVFVVEVSGNQLIERRGLGVGAGAQPPLLVCPQASGLSFVSDVVALP